jgi:cytochrome c biogenesis protein CcmG/thiol:disulfide interchange protein DsbE
MIGAAPPWVGVILRVQTASVLIFLAMLGGSPTDAAAPDSPTTLDLSTWRGRVVLLDFWASWCAPCQQSFPWMARMREAYGERGLVVVAVDLDEDPEAAASFLKRVEVEGKFVLVKDPEGSVAKAYGLTVMPTSLLYDRDGRPVYRHEGFHPERTAEYERRIVELIENRGPGTALPIAPAPTAMLGVPPWQRGVLADPVMRLTSDPLETELDDHIYFSKEASSGGRGFGGGGCGCN